ncbi:MAG: LLM class flavin-dependent oxidoreductase [Alphaproteobacteria bacterium]|nr:LLM class flavin-dependent oxidoreductase [Alphaproteobacteria bacterium]
MRFGTFLFPECSDPREDGAVIDDALAEARLCDRLGMDAVWLAEHHFDGNCAYVDPLAFAAALAVATERVAIGFAVIQTSLYHPIRLAEQLSLLDHLSKGRLILGLGRGTFFNIYEYQGYGIDADEAQARYEEAVHIIRKAWTEMAFEHHGRFWSLRVPALRPRPYTRPHPEIWWATSSEHSIGEHARHGRPVLLNAQTNDTTRRRVALYRQGMREAGFGEDAIAANVAKIWVWRSAYVGATGARAEAVGRPAFEAMIEHRKKMRDQVEREQGVKLSPHLAPGLNGFLCGAPDTVATELAELAELGIGGALIQFRLGALPYEAAAESIERFMREVAPRVRGAA